MQTGKISKIREQFNGNLWPQFLEKIDIDGLRGWNGQSIQFKFPVVAIVGENGSGKSTALKVAASAYESKGAHSKAYYPSDFFLETHWDKLSGIKLGYRIKLGDNVENFEIRKPTSRWSFPETRRSRNVYWFDVARTLPLDATAGYAKVAKLTSSVLSSSDLSDDYRKHLSYILGRDYKKARFEVPNINDKRQVGILEREFGEISQFHQGAGEDTTLDLINALQNVPDHSLVIIDEVEASLHPKAQRRLMDFLLEFVRHKRVQVILSTHSPYILEELPTEGRILLLPTGDGPKVVPGVSPEFALSKIDESNHPELIIYVEDRQAEILLREIIATVPDASDLLTRIFIQPVGPSNVVGMMGDLAYNSKLPYKAMAVLDGDEESSMYCESLPGTKAPEKVVFEDLRDRGWPKLTERFGIGAGDLFQYLEDAMRDTDHHNWCPIVGNKILKSATSVWEILSHEWAHSCLSPATRDELVNKIKTKLD